MSGHSAPADLCWSTQHLQEYNVAVVTTHHALGSGIVHGIWHSRLMAEQCPTQFVVNVLSLLQLLFISFCSMTL